MVINKNVDLSLGDFFHKNNWMSNDEKIQFGPLFKTLMKNTKKKNYSDINSTLSDATHRFKNLCMLYIIASADDEQFRFFLDIYANYSDIHYDNDLYFRCTIVREEYTKSTMLIEKGVDVTTDDNFAIIHVSGTDADSHFLQKLIQYGADVNANNGQPLINAIKNYIAENVTLLIENGADPTINDNIAICSLRTSDTRKDTQAIQTLKCLLNAGADPNARAGMPLSNCKCNKYLVKVLLEHGAVVDYLDDDDFYGIILCKNYAVAKLLVQNGANFGKLNSRTWMLGNVDKSLSEMRDLVELLDSSGIDFKLLALNLITSLPD